MALPTIIGAVVRFMAPYAKTHVERFYLSCHSHIFHFTVAKGADFERLLDRHTRIIEDELLQMLLVGKMDEVGYVVNLFPGRGDPLFPIFGELLDARLVGGDHQMATHALAERRDTRHLAATRVGVAVHAINLIDFGMDVMREFDGLLDVHAIIGALRRNRVGHLETIIGIPAVITLGSRRRDGHRKSPLVGGIRRIRGQQHG